MELCIGKKIKELSLVPETYVVFAKVDFNSMLNVEFPIGPFPMTVDGVADMQRTRFGGYRNLEQYPDVDGYNKWFADREERVDAGVEKRYLDYTAADVTGIGYPFNPLIDYMEPGQLMDWRIAYFDKDYAEHEITVTF